jgi:hypothetical protein
MSSLLFDTCISANWFVNYNKPIRMRTNSPIHRSPIL